MKNVLIVDDEAPFLLSLQHELPLCGAEFNVLTASNGKRALHVLDFAKVDLVVTALKMPEMDGLELLVYMKGKYPDVPVILMTSFGTAEIEDRLKQLDALQHLEKPLDVGAMAKAINLALGAGEGHLKGITLPTFLQLVEMEKKTATLTIRSNGRVGRLFFQQGDFVDAENDDGTGEAAAFDILSWQDASIDISSLCSRRTKRITSGLHSLLMEACRIQDEQRAESAAEEVVATPAKVAPVAAELPRTSPAGRKSKSAPAEDDAPRSQRPAQPPPPERMSGRIAEKVRDLTAVDGFSGLGVFTPEGELLAQHNTDKGDMTEIGVLANGALLMLQKTSIEMGFGSTVMVHFETEGAHILARCLDEGTDPQHPGAAKAHIHLVLILTSGASLGLAKMKLNKVATALAEDFRC
jgi:CheY-like chemotaxis protein